MLINRLKVQGLLSFGRDGIDLPLEPLNVLIGPNGSGKSNLLEVLALLKAAPRELGEPINRGGGVREWLWKGAADAGSAYVEVEVAYFEGALRHALTLVDRGGQPALIDELEPAQAQPDGAAAMFYCRPPRNHQAVEDAERGVASRAARLEVLFLGAASSTRAGFSPLIPEQSLLANSAAPGALVPERSVREDTPLSRLVLRADRTVAAPCERARPV